MPPSLEIDSLVIAMLRSLVPELGPSSPGQASRLQVTKSPTQDGDICGIESGC